MSCIKQYKLSRPQQKQAWSLLPRGLLFISHGLQIPFVWDLIHHKSITEGLLKVRDKAIAQPLLSSAITGDNFLGAQSKW